MRKHLYFGLFAALFGLGLLNTSVRAQNFPISGRVVSASINLAPNSDAVVYTTPATGHFILNQLCGGSFIQLSGDTFGAIGGLTSETPC